MAHLSLKMLDPTDQAGILTRVGSQNPHKVCHSAVSLMFSTPHHEIQSSPLSH